MKIENVALGMNELTLGVVLVAMLALLLGIAAKGRRHGVEIEAIRKAGVSKQGLANWLSRRLPGTEYRGYTHEVMDTWKVVDDGSLSSRGIEVVSPPMFNESRASIKSICDGLRGLASADSTCGLHAHQRVLDDKFSNVEQVIYGDDLEMAISLTGWMVRIAMAYAWFQAAIDGFMPSSRRSFNHPNYCGSLGHTVHQAASSIGHLNGDSFESRLRWFKSTQDQWQGVRDAMSILMSARYLNINFGALQKYGTIEFRQHGGTTNPNQISNWVDLTARLMLVCREDWSTSSLRNPQHHAPTLSGFFEWLGLGDKHPLYAFYQRRTRKFLNKLIAPCALCGHTDCDGDEYCPRQSARMPSGFHGWDDDDDDICEDCEYHEEDCECHY